MRIQGSWNVPSEWRALIVHCSLAASEYLALGYPVIREFWLYMYTARVYEASAREE